MDFQFRHIEYFYMLAGIPIMVLLFWLLVRWKRKAEKRIGDPSLVKQLTQSFSSPLFTIKFVLIVIGFGFGCLALADLVKPDASQKVERKGIDVMIAMDVSNSMLAEDIKPNRLERAKQVVGRIIDKLSDDRIGIVIFAGKAYIQMPMTTDHSAAHMYLSSVSTDDVPTQGTAIGQALKMCYSAFNTKEKKYRAVVLITDGEDHDEDAIKVAGQLADEGVMVNTVGIGSPQGSPILDKETNELKKDENGNTVISRLNEKVLQDIAAKGHGTYQLFSTTDVVANNIQAQLSSIGQTTLTDSSSMSYINYFWYFVLIAFIILLLESFIPETRRKYAGIAAVILLFVSMPASAQEKKIIKQGNDQYKKEQYKEAASTYEQVVQKVPDNTIAVHNLGNAYYRLNKPDEAMQAYDRAIETSKDRSTKARAYYNKGVALQSQQKLPECITAYKNALKLAPDDEEARQNLQRALQQQQQQEQKKDQKKDQDQKKQDQKKNEDQKKQKQEEEPKPQPSKISKQDAEEKLKSLLDHEKDLHDKLRKVKSSSPEKPKKDW